jgi:hypothetical protein
MHNAGASRSVFVSDWGGEMLTEFVFGNQKAGDHLVDVDINGSIILHGCYRRNRV